MAIYGLRQQFTISKLCKIAKISRSTYYYQIKVNGSDKYHFLKKRIQDIYAKNRGRYGYRRITATLRNEVYS